MEKEIKFRIHCAEDLEALARKLGEPTRIEHQDNYYLDTPARELAAVRAMLRIRMTENSTVMTLKRGRKVHEGYFVADELESPIDENTVDELLAGKMPINVLREAPPLQELANVADVNSLHILGIVRTERRTYNVEEGIVVELDHVRFTDGSEDFEIEIETENEDAARSYLAALFDDTSIKAKPQTQTKYERFLSRTASE